MDVIVVGASGYTGAELLRLLAFHPKVRVVGITSEQHAGKPLRQVFAHLASLYPEDLCFAAIGSPAGDAWPALDRLLKQSQFFFTALPHGTSTPCVAYLLRHGARVVDLSADFRLKNLAVYESWYGKHEAPELLPEAVYGLPEFHRKDLAKAKLVAVPGCYPTGATLAVAPLLAAHWIEPKTLIIDSKSGASGAGRTVKISSLFSEVAEGLRAYGVTHHRHTPEMEQEMSAIHGSSVQVTFTPHLVPMSRGILTCAYASLREKKNQEEILAQYASFYRQEKFVRVSRLEDPLPDTHHVLGSYFCDLTCRIDERNQRIIAISAIDNLCRGASGMAVASMNLMNHDAEDCGLQLAPIFP